MLISHYILQCSYLIMEEHYFLDNVLHMQSVTVLFLCKFKMHVFYAAHVVHLTIQ